MKDNKYAYIYTLTDPFTEEIRYVGITADPDTRWKAHNCIQGILEKQQWIQSLADYGESPVMDIIDICDYEQRYVYENYWIATFLHLGCELLNVAHNPLLLAKRKAKRSGDNSYPANDPRSNDYRDVGYAEWLRQRKSKGK